MSIITVVSCFRKILSDEDIFMRCKSNQCRRTILQIMVTTTNKWSSNCNKIGSYCPFIFIIKTRFMFVGLSGLY